MLAAVVQRARRAVLPFGAGLVGRSRAPCLPRVADTRAEGEFLGGAFPQAAFQQVRHGPKDGRPGRLEHHRFGAHRAKGRFYYRFHKLIGKWNWRKYKERFVAPRALENRQRWIPTPYATHGQMRHAHSWYWRLPRGLATATTPDEVLEVWIRFRHKLPKRTYHYSKVLKRLVDVGGCDPTDWRLKFILSRLQQVHRKVLNLPRLAKYYAQLRVTDKLEHLSRFIYPMLPKYPASQLALTAHAFGTVRLQDKHLFCDIARLAEPQLSAVSPFDLVRFAQAFAATEVCHYAFLVQVSAQVQVRVQQAAEGIAPPRSCPSFGQLTEIADAFAQLKLQDYSYFEMCNLQAEQLLREGLEGPTPPALARLCTACACLKVHDVHFFEVVFAHISDHWYDYPAASLAEIGAAVAPVLPRDSAPVREVYSKMLRLISADRDTLTLKGVEQAAKFMAEVDHRGEFLPGVADELAQRLLELRDETQERYDVGRVCEIFARRQPEHRMLFSCLCRHLHRHLGVFEPRDFVRFARGLAATRYRDDRVVHALSKWANKRLQEFSAPDWDQFVRSLEKLGATDVRVLQLRKLGPEPARLAADRATTEALAAAGA